MSAGPTPIRAITNSLSLRSTPAVPPASQTYEPLVKAVLRHRLIFRIFLYSSLFTWAAVVADAVWIQGGVTRLGFMDTLLSPLRPMNLIMSVGVWGLGVLPVLVLRKYYLTATSTPASSPAQVLKSAISKTSTAHSLLVFTFTTSVFAFIHVITSYVYEPTLGTDPGLTLFVKSKKHPYYLNGRTLYIYLSQLTISLLYFTRSILLDRFTVRFPPTLLDSSFKTFRLAKIVTSGVTMILLTSISMLLYTTLFGIGRSVVLPVVYQVPVVHRLLKPFAAHFLRGSFTFTLLLRNWSLIQRAYVLGLFTVLNWEFAEVVFDGYVAEPLTVSHVTADPFLTLTSGITSSSTYTQHFAFAELRQLTTDSSPNASARRTGLFSDQKYNPTLWATLVRTTLLVLGQDYQTFLRRGKPEEKAAQAAQKDEKKGDLSTLKIPSTPLVKGNILKASTSTKQSPLKSALETLASDGVVTAAADELGSATHLPDLFRSVMAPPATSQKAAQDKPETKPAQNVQPSKPVPATHKWAAQVSEEADKILKKYAPRWSHEACTRLQDWWTRERLSRVVESSLPNRKMDVCAIESLCALTCASLIEDRYGVVQRDIPRIIDALVSFLLSIEEYQTQISEAFAKKYPAALTSSPEEIAKLSARELVEMERERIEVGKAGEVLSEVGDALKNGLVRIAQTFGRRLTAFKFPPRIGNKLQGFVDYS